jgi:hypothetical protein
VRPGLFSSNADSLDIEIRGPTTMVLPLEEGSEPVEPAATTLAGGDTRCETGVMTDLGEPIHRADPHDVSMH